MIVTQNDKMADEARYLTTQAKDDDELFIHHQIGYNYRLTNIQAAIGCAQLESLNNYVEIKRRNFGAYQEMLLGIPGLKLLEEPRYGHSNYWYYTLVVDSKRYGLSNLELRAKLQQAQIDSKPLWTLNHHQKPYKKCQAYKIEKANSYYDRCLNLPCSVNLSVQDISKITGVIRDSYGKA
jgi:perosamine synthetase